MIVPAKLEHLEEIVAIENSSFKKPWSKTQIESDIQSEMNSKHWVYLIDGLVVGYIIGWIILNEFHLNNFAVHPDYLRRGIGKQLIQHILSKAISHDIKVVLLEVSVNNIPAHKFYVSIGFIPFGVRKDYYSKRVDAILYKLNLINNG